MFSQGTVQFMASDIVSSFLNTHWYSKGPPSRTTTFRREAHHDLESLCLVVIYSLFRRVSLSNPKDQQLKAEYLNMFGQVDLKRMADAREAALNHGHFSRLAELLMAEHPILAELAADMVVAIIKQLDPKRSDFLKLATDHDSLPNYERTLITHEHLNYILTLLLAKWEAEQRDGDIDMYSLE